MKPQRLVFVLAVVAVGCGGAHGPAPAASAAPPSEPSVLVAGGSARPGIRGRTLEGASFDLDALAGKITIVDFYEESCAPCMRGLPEVEALHKALPELAVVGVSLDDDAAAAARVAAKTGISFPVVHDASRMFAGRYRVTTLPATFVVDKTGKVRWLGQRAHTAAELRAVVDSVR